MTHPLISIHMFVLRVHFVSPSRPFTSPEVYLFDLKTCNVWNSPETLLCLLGFSGTLILPPLYPHVEVYYLSWTQKRGNLNLNSERNDDWSTLGNFCNWRDSEPKKLWIVLFWMKCLDDSLNLIHTLDGSSYTPIFVHELWATVVIFIITIIIVVSRRRIFRNHSWMSRPIRADVSVGPV